MRRTALLVSVGIAGSWVGAAHAAPAQPAQPVVTVLAAQTARTRPTPTSVAVGRVETRTPITGAATVLPVLQRAGRAWVRVALPGRPNGRSGWIRASGTRRSQSEWRLTVDLSLRRVTAFRLGRAVRSFRAVVGKSSTPTPTGTFFVEEAVRLGAGAAGGPYALALSARSNVLQEFDGGPGQIAIHGRDNLGGTLGSASSHGCVRVADSAVRWLVGRIGAGTSVTVTT